MEEREAVEELKKIYLETNESGKCFALKMAMNALTAIGKLRENCNGSCSECNYRGDDKCANDLLGYMAN